MWFNASWGESPAALNTPENGNNHATQHHSTFARQKRRALERYIIVMSLRNRIGLLAFLIGAAGHTIAQRANSLPEGKAPKPLRHAHAHNDYEHKRPLFDALECGFCSVEADVWLVDGKLLVAHDRNQVKPERTLQALYLDPLRERARRNGGRIYPDGPEVTLLVDVKSDAGKTYTALREVLKAYSDILTVFRSGSTATNAVTVIISGNRDRSVMPNETARYAALDGRLEDLDSNASSHFIPLVSESWTKIFKWRGAGPMPNVEKQTLRQTVTKAHAQGRKVRFWATPDQPKVWKELLDAGVDLLNADDLAGLQAFLLSRHPQ
jgi:hypothetical protein